MRTPEISVILPVFNGEKYLREAVKSILAQSFTDFELIIIDDGSIDKSSETIDSFNDPRISVLKNEKNMGLIYSLNRGLSEAKGKYIARMDGDDTACVDRLKTQSEFMESNPEIGLCGTFVKRFGSILRRGLLKLPVSNDEIKANSLFFCSFVHPTVMFKRELFVKNDLKYSQDFKGTEDYNLWVEMIDKGVKTANIPKPLLKYRISDWSVSGNIFFNEKKFQERLKLISEIQEKAFKSAFPGMEFETDTHSLIYKMRFHTEFLKIGDIKNISKWLKTLVEYNKVSRYCDEKVFEKAVSQIFYHVCSHATYLSVSSIHNLLNDFRYVSRIKKGKIVVKCLLKWGYPEIILKRLYLRRKI